MVMKSNDTFTAMEQKWNEFSENHKEFNEKSNKQAAKRARLSINELKKFVTAYRKLNNEDCKGIKKVKKEKKTKV